MCYARTTCSMHKQLFFLNFKRRIKMKLHLLGLQHSCSFFKASKRFLLHILGGQNTVTDCCMGPRTWWSSAFCASNGTGCVSWTADQMRSITFQNALWYWKLWTIINSVVFQKQMVLIKKPKLKLKTQNKSNQKPTTPTKENKILFLASLKK